MERANDANQQVRRRRNEEGKHEMARRLRKERNDQRMAHIHMML
jgi:hypothetical protein